MIMPQSSSVDGTWTHAILAPVPIRPLVTPETVPTFSVVIAAYQVAHMIGDAIQSVLAQTQPALEVLVIDDGSTDDVEAAVRPYGSEVTLLRREHGGAGAAMNTGAQEATGDYVCFIGADDLFAQERLAALTEMAVARPDLDVLTTDAWLSVRGEIFRRFNDETLPFVVSDQRAVIVDHNFVFGHTAVRRERFIEVGGFDESIRWTSDWELWARLILSGSAIGSIDVPLATYRLHEGSLSAKRLEQARGRLMTCDRICEHPSLRPVEYERAQRRILAIQREIAWGEAKQACVERKDDARVRSLHVLRDSDQTRAVRLRALTATLSPVFAARVLTRDQLRHWTGAGGLRVRRAQ